MLLMMNAAIVVRLGAPAFEGVIRIWSDGYDLDPTNDSIDRVNGTGEG